MVSTKLGSDNEFWSSVNLTQVIQRQLDVVVEDAAPLTPTLSTRMDVVNDEEATQEEGGGPSEEIKASKLTHFYEHQVSQWHLVFDYFDTWSDSNNNSNNSIIHHCKMTKLHLPYKSN